MTPLVTVALAAVTALHALTATAAEVPTRPPIAALPPTVADDRAAVVGTVRGRVTDEASGQPIAAAQVVVVGSANRQGTVTDNDGRYLLRGVAAGRLTLRVLRIGYAARTIEVTVVDDGEVTADVTLGRTLTQLEAVVTTATGLQSRREVGNVIGSIRADTLAAQAPVTNVTELLQARTPGVQVLQGNGNTGASPSIRIRGASSLSLSNEPLVIVDGVRIDNSAQPGGIGGVSTTRVNRLSVFSPDDIESIDVLKGPSAAALYGTAAANGVLVITTKKGASGRTQWRAFGEQGRVEQPAKFFDNYRSWGRNIVNGVPATAAIACRISDQSLGRCVRDSLTTFNPLMNADVTPFATTPRRVFGLQASGGSQLFRFFASAEREDETGPFEMPAAEVARITALRGSAPREDQIHPNRLKQTALRGNFGVPLGKSASLNVSTGFIDRTLNTPFEGSFFQGLWNQTYFAPGFRTPTGGTSAQYIGDIMSVNQQLRDQRVTGSASLNWQPVSWLETRAVTGLDQNANYGYRFARVGEGTNGGWGPPGLTGGRDATRNTYSRYSVDLGATASWKPLAWLTTRTSVGGQWFKDTQYETAVQGYQLPPGAQNPNGAVTQRTFEQTNENATYGAFIEEVLGWSDTRFVTLGVRTDQNSAFGRSVGNTIYPRAALSWALSDESFFPKAALHTSNVRLRGAFGQAGVQPTTIAALQFLTAFAAPIGGADVAALRLQSLGNANLKPEVTTELEGGLDIGFLADRLTLEATYFSKQSRDALFNNPLAPSVGTSQTGAPTQWQNLAKVRNSGLELAVNAQVIKTRPFSWNLRVNGSTLANKLVTVGGAQLAVTQGSRNVVGYPLFGLWARPIRSFADADNDGILTEREVVVGDTAEYKGSTLPTREGGITNSFGLFNDQLRISTVLDYRGGFYNQWGFENQRCVSGNCRAVSDPTTPLPQQAAAVATTSALLGNTVWGFFVPNDFVRFRELSISGTVPEGLVRRSRLVRTASVTLSGRNLGLLYNRFPGIDPETNWLVANAGGGNSDQYASPPLRYWLLRFNLGL
jgi:TonB-linked SusC/RagA family outer membrane protein